MAWAWVHKLAAAARDTGWETTRLQLAVEGRARCGTHGGTNRGFTPQELDREWANQAGWSGPCAGKEKGKEKKSESGPPRLRPNRGLINSKGFPISNLFRKFKLIWIQIKFEM
jgi:hypothetical protein